MNRYLLVALLAAVGASISAVANGKSAKEVFAEASGGIVVVNTIDANGAGISQGSGVVVGTNEVATNCHVVRGTGEITVRQAADVRGRETYRMIASLAAQNESRDLCVLFVKELSDPPAAIPVSFGLARNVSIGDEVYAIGAPHGLELSLSRGIVSQLRGEGGKRAAPIIQTDAAISPGSSGGGLFNQEGELIGITTFKASGTRTEGLSFAIPVEWVVELAASIEAPLESDTELTLSVPADHASYAVVSRDQMAMLNRQVRVLRVMLDRAEEALRLSERKNQEQEVKIAELNQRLNLSPADEIEELAAYRSEFFGRLGERLSDRRDFTIIGDRFVFQSEVLFASASEKLEAGGHERLAKFAQVLKQLMVQIPADIPWVLQVDGHTDSRPIQTARFPSNWELSAIRAISVVNFLIASGIPPDRLSATGYGEFQPLDNREDEIAYRRNRRIEFRLTRR